MRGDGEPTLRGVSERLTTKQELFVQRLVAGSSQREAYRAAYGCVGWQDSSVDCAASKLMAVAKVSQRYEERVAELASRVLWDRERAVNTLLEAQAIAIEKVKQSAKSYVDPLDGKRKKPKDVPKDAAKLVMDSTAELNKLFGIYDAGSGEGKVTVIIDV